LCSGLVDQWYAARYYWNGARYAARYHWYAARNYWYHAAEAVHEWHVAWAETVDY